MISPALFSSETDQWATPRARAREWVLKYGITLDVCADAQNAVVPRFFTREQNGLAQRWTGERVWCNPPYGEGEDACPPRCKKKRCVKRGHHCTEYIPGIGDWVRRCSRAANRTLYPGAAALAVMLLPARTCTSWWHDFIWDEQRECWRPGVEGTFLRGRLRFNEAKNAAPFPSALIVFGAQ